MPDITRSAQIIFSADTSQAKAEINSLVQSLRTIQSTPTSFVNVDNIRQASAAATELENHLRRAVNTSTGKIDLTRFSASLGSANTTLAQLTSRLQMAGTTGEAAFKRVAAAINQAEIGNVRLTKGLSNFLVTMKNTIKWNLSSGIMNGVISGIQNAISYAQQLDESLNRIRIVTGDSKEQMARFAVEANRAAQTLSTTTTKYTDAALIFYQQGLGDKDVKARTDAVIKMANVTGDAAKDVSSYMTAIWNNFKSGSDTLESFEDKIVALGATTASSSAEIAAGIEKFASLGSTIGLSFDYAAAALATVVAETRQSAETVGTAYKTIFSRLQGLKLGETLEDGTTLNKYSKALQAVGVNIKDASGQLKEMDTILDELGAKWQTLGKDAQVALAQTVGGARQYTTLISLMDNWEEFQENLHTEATASGELNRQAEIYAESWEAARDRVKAATQGLYDALINEDVFIDLDKMFTKLLEGVTGFVKGMGGMMPILGTIGGFITQKLAKEAPIALQRISENFAILSGHAAKNQAFELQHQITTEATQKSAAATNPYEQAQYESLRRISEMREKLLLNQHKMNSAEKEHYQALIENEQAVRKIVEARAKDLALAQEATAQAKERVAAKAFENTDIDNEMVNKQIFQQEPSLSTVGSAMKQDLTAAGMINIPMKIDESNIMEVQIALEKLRETGKTLSTESTQWLSKVDDSRLKVIAKVLGQASEQAKKTGTEIANLGRSYGQATQNVEKIGQVLKEMPESTKATARDMDSLREKMQDMAEHQDDLGLSDESRQELENLDTSSYDQLIAKLERIKQLEEEAAQLAQARYRTINLADSGLSEEDAGTLWEAGRAEGEAQSEGDTEQPELPEIETRSAGMIESLTAIAGAAMQVTSAITAVSNAFKVWNSDASFLEKLTATMGAVVSVFMALNAVSKLASVLQTSVMATTWATTAAKYAETAATGTLSVAVWKAVAANLAWMASNPIGWIMAAVAAIAALTAGIVLLVKAMNQPTKLEKQLEKEKKNVETLTKAVDNLKSHISDIESAWDNYQSMEEALKKCTKGTEDWNTALMNCNESILSLLQLSPALAQYIQYGADGQLSLAGEEYENYLKGLKLDQTILSAAKIVSQANVEELTTYSEYSDEAQQIQSITGGDTGLESQVVNSINSIFGKYFDLQSNGTYKFKTDVDQIDYVQSLSDVYELLNRDRTAFINFLDATGLGNSIAGPMGAPLDSTTAADAIIGNYAGNYGLYRGGSGMKLTGIELSTAQNHIDAAVATARANRKAAYTTMFSGINGYSADASLVYGAALEEVLPDVIETITGDTKSLKKQMLAAFQGSLEDYEGMSDDAMRQALAYHKLTTGAYINSEGEAVTFDTIVADSNKFIESLAPAAQTRIKGDQWSSNYTLAQARTQIGGPYLNGYTTEELRNLPVVSTIPELARKPEVARAQLFTSNQTNGFKFTKFDTARQAYLDSDKALTALQTQVGETRYSSADYEAAQAILSQWPDWEQAQADLQAEQNILQGFENQLAEDQNTIDTMWNEDEYQASLVRLGDMQDTVAEVQAKLGIAGSSDAIVELLRQRDALNTTIESEQGNLQGIDVSLNGLEEGNVEGLYSQYELMGSVLEGIDNTYEEMIAEIPIGEDLEVVRGLYEQHDNLVGTLTDLGSQSRELVDAIGTRDIQIGVLDEQIADLDSQLEDLYGQRARYESIVNALPSGTQTALDQYDLDRFYLYNDYLTSTNGMPVAHTWEAAVNWLNASGMSSDQAGRMSRISDFEMQYPDLVSRSSLRRWGSVDEAVEFETYSLGKYFEQITDEDRADAEKELALLYPQIAALEATRADTIDARTTLDQERQGYITDAQAIEQEIGQTTAQLETNTAAIAEYGFDANKTSFSDIERKLANAEDWKAQALINTFSAYGIEISPERYAEMGNAIAQNEAAQQTAINNIQEATDALAQIDEQLAGYGIDVTEIDSEDAYNDAIAAAESLEQSADEYAVEVHEMTMQKLQNEATLYEDQAAIVAQTAKVAAAQSVVDAFGLTEEDFTDAQTTAEGYQTQLAVEDAREANEQNLEAYLTYREQVIAGWEKSFLWSHDYAEAVMSEYERYQATGSGNFDWIDTTTAEQFDAWRDNVQQALNMSLEDIFTAYSPDAWNKYIGLNPDYNNRQIYEFANTDAGQIALTRARHSGQEQLIYSMLGLEGENRNLTQAAQVAREQGFIAEGVEFNDFTSDTDYENLIAGFESSDNKEQYYQLAMRNWVLGDKAFTSNKYTGDEGARAFARDYGLYSEGELLDEKLVITWEDAYERWMEAVEDNMENNIDALNKVTSKRLRNEIIVDDKGNYALAEGADETSYGNRLGLSLLQKGITTAETGELVTLLDYLAPKASNVDLDTMVSSITDMIDAGYSVAEVMEYLNAIISGDTEEIERLEGTFVNAADAAAHLRSAASKATTSVENLTDAISSMASNFSTLYGNLGGLTKGKEVKEKAYQEAIATLTPERQKIVDSYFSHSVNGRVYLGDQNGISLSDLMRQWFREDSDTLLENYRNLDTAGRQAQASMEAHGGSFYTDWAGRSKQGTYTGLTQSDDGVYSMSISPEMIRYFAKNEGSRPEWFNEDVLAAAGMNNADELATMDLSDLVAQAALFNQYMTGALNGEYGNGEEIINEMITNTAESTSELYQLKSQGTVTSGQAYDVKYETLARSEMKDLGFDEDEYTAFADLLQSTYGYLEDNREAALDMAKAQMRLNRAVDDGSKNIKTWQKNMQAFASSGEMGKLAGNLKDMRKAYADMANVDSSKLSRGFLTNADNLELFNAALEGGEEELRAFKAAVADDLFGAENGTDTKTTIQELDQNGEVVRTITVGVDETMWDNFLAETQPMLDDLDLQIEAGAELDLSDFNRELGKLQFNTAQSAAAAQASLGAIGMKAHVEAHKYTIAPSHREIHYRGTAFGGMEGENPNGVPIDYTVTEDVEGGSGVYYTLVADDYTPTKPSSGGGGGGGGGGGRRGGGGGGRRETGDKKRKEKRYVTNTNQLEDLQKIYERINKSEERTYGRDRIKQMQMKAKALDDLVKKQHDLYNEAVKYQEQDKNDLLASEFAKKAGIELEFDENGTILNRDAIEQAMIDYYNSFTVDTKDDDGKYALKDGVSKKDYDQMKEDYEEFQKLLDKYDESQDKVKEYWDQEMEYLNEKYDLLVEMASYTVEVKVQVSESALKILDFMLKQVEDDAYAAAKAIATLGKKSSEYIKQDEINRQGIADILNIHNGKTEYSKDGKKYKTTDLTGIVDGLLNNDATAWAELTKHQDEFTQNEIDNIQKFVDAELEATEQLMELQKETYEQITTVFDAMSEEMGRYIDQIEHLTSLTENYINIVDIVGKKHLGITNDFLAETRLAQVDQGINKLMATRTKYLKQQEMYQNLQSKFAGMSGNTMTASQREILQQMAVSDQYDQATRDRFVEMAANPNATLTDRDVSFIKEQMRHLEEEINASQEEFTQSWEDALTSIADWYIAKMEGVIEDVSDKLAGAMGSLQELADQFDKRKTLDEQYVADYERIYELSKLNRDIMKSIDETDNVKSKQALVELQAEINQMDEDNVELSRYQIENARRRYELTLAQLQLEESKNTKSQVQMMRSDTGEWSYVYTADETAVEEAEQNYEDKLFAMQQANAEYINELQNLIIESEQAMMDELAELRVEDFANAEEYEAARDAIIEHYTERMRWMGEQMGIVLEENRILYTQDWQDYADATGYKISADQAYIDNWNETNYSKLTGFETLAEAQAAFNAAVQEYLDESNEAYYIWEEKTEEAMEAAGTSMEDYRATMDSEMSSIIEDSANATSSIETMGEVAVSTFDSMSEAVANWQAEYSSVLDEMLSKNAALAESFNKLLKEWSGFNETVMQETDKPSESSNTDTSDQADTKTEGTVGEKKDNGSGRSRNRGGRGGTNGNTSSTSDTGIYGVLSTVANVAASTVQKAATVASAVTRAASDPKKNTELQLRYLAASNTTRKILDRRGLKPAGLATGGYTGDWDTNDGRLAILHEKELVLNKEDTANFLAGIGILREITSAIDINALANVGYLASMAMPGIVGAGTLEQEVHITAEFPNVTDRNEIEAAFGDLINLASQYANRK